MIIPTFSPYSSSEVEELPHALLASQVTQKKLKNGLSVLVKEVYPASVVCISVWTGIGSVYESDDLCGISHFIEHMLFKGTETRPVGKIAQEIHSLGGYINGFTSYACTCYWIVLPSRYFSTATDIMADALVHPLFNPREIEKERGVIIEEIKMYQDRPESFCFERLMGLAYKKHRARRPITGYEEVVAKISNEQLIEFYRQHYFPGNMAIVVVGDVKTKKALGVIKDTFGSMAGGVELKEPSPDEPPQDSPRSEHYRGDIGTSYFYKGYHVAGITSPEMYACDLLASILGEGRSSRLHQGLREKKALVTSIDASILALKDTGLLIVEAVMDEKNIEDTRCEVEHEIQRIQTDGVSSHELKKAKNMVESSYIFSQETVEGLCRKLGYYEMIGDYTLVDQYVRGLYAVTEEEVREAAREYLLAENSSEVLYLPGGPGR